MFHQFETLGQTLLGNCVTENKANAAICLCDCAAVPITTRPACVCACSHLPTPLPLDQPAPTTVNTTLRAREPRTAARSLPDRRRRAAVPRTKMVRSAVVLLSAMLLPLLLLANIAPVSAAPPPLSAPLVSLLSQAGECRAEGEKKAETGTGRWAGEESGGEERERRVATRATGGP